jgi:predicted NBD/HSP70 family sugar kinase
VPVTRLTFALILTNVSIDLGIDIGGTTVKAAGLREGEVLWTGRSARYNRPAPEQLAAAIRQACEKLTEAPSRVGLCVPGLLDEGKTQVTSAANVPGLVGIPLKELIGRALETAAPDITVVNDAKATAFDIYSVRKPAGRLLVLALGTGLGAAVLDDGVPLHVEGESPGHIGQVDISLEGRRVIGPDGGRGGVEGYLGAIALRNRYGSDPPSKIRPGDIPFRALVRVMRICHAFYRPHHICLAGGTGIRLGPLLDPLKRATEVELTSVARKGWTLTVGESDFHAAAGAARIARA